MRSAPEGMRAQFNLVAAAALTVALAMAGCADTSPSLLLTVEDDQALGPTQLRVVVTVGGNEGSEVIRPLEPGAPLAPGQTIRLLLPDASVGGDVALAIEGIREQQVIALASGTFSIDSVGEHAVSVTLEPAECLADEDCGAVTCMEPGTCDRGVCQRTPLVEGTACSSDSLCVSNESCDGSGSCGAGSPVVCLDAIFGDCLVPLCDPTQGCIAVAADDGFSCDDQNACTVGDSCVAGTCRGGAFPCSGDAVCCPEAGGYACLPPGSSGPNCTATQ